MKRIFSIFAAAALVFSAASCDLLELPGDNTANQPVDVTVQLNYNGSALAAEGVTISLQDLNGTVTYDAVTNASGAATFGLRAGSYSAKAIYKVLESGKRIAYNGANDAITVVASTPASFSIDMARVESQQIIIKELYVGGCPKADGSGAYSNDAYVILYNNSEFEADATDIQFTFAGPYNAHGTNKYYANGALSYETASWLPAYGAIWWFTGEVKIPAYSQIVVAIFGGIDHSKTQPNSVDLSNSAYYVMSNSGITQYSNAKYTVSDNISKSHYLTCSPYTMGNAWALSNACPAFFIGKAKKEEALALSTNTAEFDHTMGTSKAFDVVKYPQANVIDAVEVWSSANVAKSQVRFPKSINTGYVALTNQKGFSIYRNVDREATEALPENEGKLVYNYIGGTSGYSEGSTDPANIDAEASIAAGAHIIYSDTNNSATDFHQRNKASLKK